MNRRDFVAGSAAFLAAANMSAQPPAQPLAQASAPTSAQPLRAAGDAAGLPVGCAVAVAKLSSDPAYAALVKAQAGIVVAEFEMKFGPLRPSPTTFNFHAADTLLAFAQANGMKLRGHNFVWHRSLPAWFAGYATPANAAALLTDHIEQVGARYASKIHSWDVVNEAIEPRDGLPGGVRNTPWQKLLGGDRGGAGHVPEYIELAFRTARRADPQALLVYNDYGIEAEDSDSATKRQAVLQLLRSMQARNIPIDALGVQSHIAAGDGSVYGKGLMQLIHAAHAMGLKVLLTEMDVNDRRLPPAIPARDAAVAAAYAGYLQTALASPAVIALLTWGITDRYTWLDEEQSRADKLPERPLPFDAALQPKPAVASIRAALNARSSTGNGTAAAPVA